MAGPLATVGFALLFACSGGSSSPSGDQGGDSGSNDDGGNEGDASAASDASSHDAASGVDGGASHDAAPPQDSASHGGDSAPCTPFCGSMACGDDGCGGSCGSCPPSYTCVINGSCQLDPGSQCGNATCGSAASCCHCNGQPICYALLPHMTCADLGAGCN